MVIPVQPKHLTTTLRQSRDDARDGSCQIGGLELLLDTRHVTDPLAEGEPPPVGTERVERAVADRAIEIGRDRTGNLPDAPPLHSVTNNCCTTSCATSREPTYPYAQS